MAMMPNPAAADPPATARRGDGADFEELAPRILRCAHAGLPLLDFLREAVPLVLDASGWQVFELWLDGPARNVHARGRRSSVSIRQFAYADRSRASRFFRAAGRLAGLPRVWASGRHPIASPGGAATPSPRLLGRYLPRGWRLAALVPLDGGGTHGMCLFCDNRRSRRAGFDIARLVHAAQLLGGAITERAAQASLRERVKELTCLYQIARLSQQPEMDLGELLQQVTAALPPAWLNPEKAQARIQLDGRHYQTERFRPAAQRQAAAIVVAGRRRGSVEVAYSGRQPPQDEGPFLAEERALLDTVARQISLIIESRQSQQERHRLQEQLRHADRLATLGQLSAGIAHELNEPLASILGFAQLIHLASDLSDQTRADIEKVIKASLHAREVVKKLLLFGRQVPTRTSLTDLNKIVAEGIYFLESRCTRENIVLQREIDSRLPPIVADASQMHQVLVNLVVNAIQAMAGGGRLTIRTECRRRGVALVVADTGHGMSEEVQQQIFTPFFTTKGVGHGTGLGLSVVHGIVSTHGGSIEVHSQPGRGSRFEVVLPLRPRRRKGHAG